MKIQSIFKGYDETKLSEFGWILAIYLPISFQGYMGYFSKQLKGYGIPGTLLPGPHCQDKNDLQRKKYNFDTDHAWHCIGPDLSSTCLLSYDTSSQRVKVGHLFPKLHILVI